MIGQTVAHYTIVEKLGEGGMGVVCRAEQQEPIRRQVAIKLIKLGIETEHKVLQNSKMREKRVFLEHNAPVPVGRFDGLTFE